MIFYKLNTNGFGSNRPRMLESDTRLAASFSYFAIDIFVQIARQKHRYKIIRLFFEIDSFIDVNIIDH